jgi:hypothetical protein
MPAGRPRQYETVEDLEAVIEDYFESCWVDKVTESTDKEGTCTMSTVRYQQRPYTVTGLALHLNLTRKGLLEYQGREEFSNTITRAKQRVEMGYEETLFSKFANGASFGLKENFGWKDVQHRSHSFDFSKCTDEELEAIAAGQGEA